MIHALLASLRLCLSQAVLAGLLVLCWCWSAAAQARDVLLVFGAASLKNALDDVNAPYEQREPYPKILVEYGASSTLARRIENGDPADVPTWIGWTILPSAT